MSDDYRRGRNLHTDKLLDLIEELERQLEATRAEAAQWRKMYELAQQFRKQERERRL